MSLGRDWKCPLPSDSPPPVGRAVMCTRTHKGTSSSCLLRTPVSPGATLLSPGQPGGLLPLGDSREWRVWLGGHCGEATCAPPKTTLMVSASMLRWKMVCAAKAGTVCSL